MKLKFIFALSMLLLSCNVCFAEKVSYDFEAKVRGINIAVSNFSYNIGDVDYSAETSVHTSGIFNGIYPFESVYISSGIMNNGNFLQQNYQDISKSRFNTRKKTLIFDENGKVIKRISKKNEKEKHVDVKSPENVDFADLQSVFLSILKKIKETDSCEANFNIFNGKREFFITFREEGKEEVSTDFYTGSALKCLMYIKTKNQNGDFIFDNTANNDIYIWFAKDKKTGVAFAVKSVIEDSPLGALVVHTKNWKVEE